jgi:D-beta-D-heptose 7-phosphate kinase/D-beta-D-heptose 1-phosphate adenosyltransferase
MEGWIMDFSKLNIAVVGDMMLDVFLWGTTTRLSSEAPVPIVNIANVTKVLGGMGNVISNLHNLGVSIWPYCILGREDENSDYIRMVLKAWNIPTVYGLCCDNTRTTTIKTRVISDGKHVVRIDDESTTEISKKLEKIIEDDIRIHIKSYDAVLISDYNKGVVTKTLCKSIIKICNDNGIIVVVDPKTDFIKYKNATVVTPNLSELSVYIGYKPVNKTMMVFAGKKMLKNLNCKYLVVTASEAGMYLFGKGSKDVVHVESEAKSVYDVTGAGDTAVSILTACLALKMSVEDSVRMANKGAGIVVGKIGTYPILLNEL